MYATVTVVVDGALDEEAEFHDYALLDEYLTDVEHDAKSHGYLTQVYILHHHHGSTDEGCECIQFETDLRPTRTFNERTDMRLGAPDEQTTVTLVSGEVYPSNMEQH